MFIPDSHCLPFCSQPCPFIGGAQSTKGQAYWTHANMLPDTRFHYAPNIIHTRMDTKCAAGCDTLRHSVLHDFATQYDTHMHEHKLCHSVSHTHTHGHKLEGHCRHAVILPASRCPPLCLQVVCLWPLLLRAATWGGAPGNGWLDHENSLLCA